MEAPRDSLLQELIHHEKTVVGKVEEARAEAERIVAHARNEAREALEKARTQGEALAREAAERAHRDADAARATIVGEAQQVVAELERRAMAQRDAAVAVVVEQVLP